MRRWWPFWRPRGGWFCRGEGAGGLALSTRGQFLEACKINGLVVDVQEILTFARRVGGWQGKGARRGGSLRVCGWGPCRSDPMPG